MYQTSILYKNMYFLSCEYVFKIGPIELGSYN